VTLCGDRDDACLRRASFATPNASRVGRGLDRRRAAEARGGTRKRRPSGCGAAASFAAEPPGLARSIPESRGAARRRAAKAHRPDRAAEAYAATFGIGGDSW
jgi:hypothetical protein